MDDAVVIQLISGSPEQFEQALAISTRDQRRLALDSIRIARRLVEHRQRLVEARLAHLREQAGIAGTD